jgi:DNA-binding MarR family transcriptional regulator
MSVLHQRGALFTDVVLEIFRLNRLLLDAGDVLTAPAGLTSARWQVLGIVEHGPATVSDVARAMGLTRQSVQETTNGLQAERFVEFAPNPRHRRATLIAITPKGNAAMQTVRRRHAIWANEVGGLHEAAALGSTVAMLREVRASLDERAASRPVEQVAS